MSVFQFCVFRGVVGYKIEVKRAKARLKARTEPSRALGSAQLSSPISNSEKAQLSSARQIQFLKKLSSAQLAKLKLPAQLIFLSL